MYKTDKERVEDAFLPLLMISILRTRDGIIPEKWSVFQDNYPILYKAVRDDINTEELKKEVDELVDFCLKYFERNKFKTSKAFLVTTVYGGYLYRRRGVLVRRKSPLHRLWRDCYNVARIDAKIALVGYDKLKMSADKHVTKLHTLVQDKGYF